MSSNFEKRNQTIRQYCATTEKRYPHWKLEYIMEKAADRFFLSPRTINAIVKGEGIYAY